MMTTTTTISLSLILLFLGINLTANNRFITFILKYLFFGNNLSKVLVRLLGIIILTSLVLLLMQMYYYVFIVNIIVLIIFIFFTIQGRNKAKCVAEQNLHEMKITHTTQIQIRKNQLAKTRSRKIKELEQMRNKPQSIEKMKNNLWDDGSKTNKELIRDLTN